MYFCTNQMYILLYLFWKGILSCTGKDCHKFVEVIGELVLSLLAAFATPLKTNAVISPANSYLNGRFHTRDGLSVFKICQNWWTNRCIKSETYYLSDTNYRKIPKISPGAYIFQRPFLRGLFLEGLIFGGRFKIDWTSLINGRKFTVFSLFYLVFEDNFQVQAPRGAYIWRGDLTEGFFCVTGLEGLYLEGLIFGILRHGLSHF